MAKTKKAKTKKVATSKFFEETIRLRSKDRPTVQTSPAVGGVYGYLHGFDADVLSDIRSWNLKWIGAPRHCNFKKMIFHVLRTPKDVTRGRLYSEYSFSGFQSAKGFKAVGPKTKSLITLFMHGSNDGILDSWEFNVTWDCETDEEVFVKLPNVPPQYYDDIDYLTGRWENIVTKCS